MSQPDPDEALPQILQEYAKRLQQDCPEPTYPLRLGYDTGELLIEQDGSVRFRRWTEQD
jgi:hypothetical protein